ncbi:hypothetical protein AVDCRST_MAG84-3109 [uncultured Microcoleus sp.]|uniref:Uncharacterized protein n=1 Tax=uncultured Microcoleus sp. TaxID=259945 RepID=A0A6J4ME59_9CYAN|nr:hypothetical protein AVDCRST_MAG84-3109 [uncultured Microcoleus sp.]
MVHFRIFDVLLQYAEMSYVKKIDGVKIMIARCLIPFTICLIAWWVTAGTDNRTLDGIPAPIAAIIGMCSLIWLVAVCPWPVELALVLAVLVFGKAYLQKILKVG